MLGRLELGLWGWTALLGLVVALLVRLARRRRLADPEADLAAERSWHARHILPHGPICQLCEDLHIVEGTMPYGPPRNMVIFSLPSGELLLYSVVALREDAMRELEQLGRPKYMIVPSALHLRDAARYRARFPHLVVLCSLEDHAAVASVVPDAVCFEVAPGLLAELGLQVLCIPGLRPMLRGERVLVLPVYGGRKRALLFCDLIFNLAAHQTSIVARLLGSGPFFGVTRIGRWFGVADRHAVRQFLAELCMSVKRVAMVLVCHGEPVVDASANAEASVIPELLAAAL